MAYKQIYCLHRDIDDPTRVIHESAFGGMGFGNIEDYSFTQRFNIISITDKEIVVQEKDKTV